jgi:hypothetical protein
MRDQKQDTIRQKLIFQQRERERHDLFPILQSVILRFDKFIEIVKLASNSKNIFVRFTYSSHIRTISFRQMQDIKKDTAISLAANAFEFKLLDNRFN